MDLGGRSVIPGLFNTHCHVQMVTPAIVADGPGALASRFLGRRQVRFNVAECLRRGVTTVRDAATEDLEGNRRLQEAIEWDGQKGPRILQAVYVGMHGSAWTPYRKLENRLLHLAAGLPWVDFEEPNSGSVTFEPDADAGRVREAVDRAVDERGARFIKVYEEPAQLVTYRPGAPIMSFAQLEALVDRARARGVPVTMHHGTVEALRRGVRAGVTSLAHLPFDRLLVDDDVRALVDSGCILEPTVSMAWDLCWKLDGDANRHHPRLDRLTRQRRRNMMDLVDAFWIGGLAGTVKSGLQRVEEGRTISFGTLDMSAPFRYFSDIVTHGIDNFNRLFEAGATIACGNDGGVPPCTVPMIGQELAMMDFCRREAGEPHGLTGAEALRIACLNSARTLGMEDRAGSLARGRMADLVVLDGDPFQNPDLLGSPAAAVFRDGRLVANPAGLDYSTSNV